MSFRPRFRKEAVLVNVCHLQFTLRVRLHILTYVPSRSAGPPAHPLTHDRTANPQSQTARAHSSSLSQRVSDAFTLPPGRPCGMGPWRARLTSADPYRHIGRFPSPRRLLFSSRCDIKEEPKGRPLALVDGRAAQVLGITDSRIHTIDQFA